MCSILQKKLFLQHYSFLVQNFNVHPLGSSCGSSDGWGWGSNHKPGCLVPSPGTWWPSSSQVSQTPFVWIKLDVKFYQICRVLSFSTKVLLFSASATKSNCMIWKRDMRLVSAEFNTRWNTFLQLFSSVKLLIISVLTMFLQCEIIQVKCFDTTSEEQCLLLNQLVHKCTLDVLGEQSRSMF